MPTSCAPEGRTAALGPRHPKWAPRRHLHPAAVVHAASGSPGFSRSPAVVEIAAADEETAPAVQELPAAPCDRTGRPYEPGARRAR
ncbi:DUF6207 family protein [Streptomyces taklimakanensis]|uniref:DUF6207 family protein n=1 Tax=Streptomyces taklimakanensis TaxID=2569853 RepID=UPI003B75B787